MHEHSPIHNDDLPDPLPQPALNQQRHIKDTHPLASPPMPQHTPEHLTAHGGVHDTVELATGALVREDDAPELGPVERAVGEEDVGPERAHDGGERRGARLDDFAREDVCIDDGDVVCAKE